LKQKLEHSFSLKVRELRKSFLTPEGRNLEVLRGVSMEVRAGEMVAVRGASGAGKTTLLQVIGGLEEADRGDCLLGDFNIARARAGALARFRNREVGFVFQFHHLLPDLTALENVAMPLLIGRASKQESLRRAGALLERVGLRERADHLVSRLSGGEQQRVSIARAVVLAPRLILADEPTGNLDSEAAGEISSLLASFCREQGSALLITTHNERLAEACDRTFYLRDGKLEIE
jgi:lipoprotein-releasing system ATP-binding protein